MHFMAVEKSKKRSLFVVYSYFKDSTLTAVKRDIKFFILPPAKVCNFHMLVFQIKVKYHYSKPTKLQKFLM